MYLGGTQFNARMNARNFDRPAIKDALEFCHSRGVKVYVTMNTLLCDRQMKDALEYVAFLYEAGVDALIVADLGLAREISARFPAFPLHASTQASGHNAEAARFLAERGFCRMVCARELSKENIAALCSQSPIEIEAFVHGALCVSQSGQCLFSSIVGGRSGNQGACAQPCRLPYNGKYPLSLKDNCLAAHVKELIDMGVASFKIEGRMKNPEYVFNVVSTYRRLLDEQRGATNEEIARMARVFSRDGFTDGYFTGRVDGRMNGVRREADVKASEKETVRIKDICPEREQIVIDRPAVTPAPYQFKRNPPPPKRKESARFYNPASIPEKHTLSEIYLPLDRFDGRKANGVLFPPVIPDSEREGVKKALLEAKARGAKHALVGNIGHIELARECGFILHGDYRLNVTNSSSAALFYEIFEDVILCPELILPQARDIGGEKSFLVYGRVPLMTLEKPIGTEKLRDRKGVEFPVLSEGGRQIVFNSLPTYMGDRTKLLEDAGIFNRHYLFTTEGPKECETMMNYYKKGLPIKKEVRRIK